MLTYFTWSATNSAEVFSGASTLFSDFLPFLQTMVFPIIIVVLILSVLLNALKH